MTNDVNDLDTFTKLLPKQFRLNRVQWIIVLPRLQIETFIRPWMAIDFTVQWKDLYYYAFLEFLDKKNLLYNRKIFLL